MLNINIGGESLRITFRHFTSEKDFPGTECLVYRGEEQVPTLEGRSFITGKDMFNKETGRKISLARAIHLLPREDRAKIWGAYFNRK